MNVFGRSTDKEEQWTAPFPDGTIGVKLRWMGGDLVSPDIEGGTYRTGREGEKKNWFNVIPERVRIEYHQRPCKIFFSIGIGKFGFYMGHKVFGMDSDAYLDYPGIGSEDVYTGSRAMTGFTARFTTNRPRRST